MNSLPHELLLLLLHLLLFLLQHLTLLKVLLVRLLLLVVLLLMPPHLLPQADDATLAVAWVAWSSKSMPALQLGAPHGNYHPRDK